MSTILTYAIERALSTSEPLPRPRPNRPHPAIRPNQKILPTFGRCLLEESPWRPAFGSEAQARREGSPLSRRRPKPVVSNVEPPPSRSSSSFLREVAGGEPSCLRAFQRQQKKSAPTNISTQYWKYHGHPFRSDESALRGTHMIPQPYPTAGCISALAQSSQLLPRLPLAQLPQILKRINP
jgi:hypothetical protein